MQMVIKRGKAQSLQKDAEEEEDRASIIDRFLIVKDATIPQSLW
jgi:hypothetical protein